MCLFDDGMQKAWAMILFIYTYLWLAVHTYTAPPKKVYFISFFTLYVRVCTDDNTWQSICIDWIYKERKARQTF